MARSNLAIASVSSAPLWTHSATELAAMIRAKEVSSLEVVEAHLARMEEVNPKLNALIWPRAEDARREAREADRREPTGALHGVPVTVKECLDLAGTPSTFGVTSRSGHRAPKDDRYVARWRKAGAVVLGKTNVAQLLMFLESDNPLYGRTNNPWDLTRSPGGSSGGEAALIATGASPLGLGTDLGGSLRAPAAMCGLCSLKPTAGRMPDNGRFSLPFGQQAISSQVGVLGRTVDDVALGLEVAHGAPLSTGPVALEKLRVGWYEDDGLFAPSPAVKRAVKLSLETLRARGVEVEPFKIPGLGEAMRFLYGLLGGDGGAGFSRTLGKTKRDPRVGLLEMLGSASAPKRALLGMILSLTGRGRVRAVLQCFGRTDADAYFRLAERLHDWREEFAAAMDAQRLDALLCPALALPAVKHGATYELGLIGMYTALFNVLGWPAGVVPVTRVGASEESVRVPGRDVLEKVAQQTEQGSAGLPIAVQIAARPMREDVALGLMGELYRQRCSAEDFPSLPLRELPR